MSFPEPSAPIVASHPEASDLSLYPNLASPRLGTRVHAVSDEFFGERSRMLDDVAPVFIPGKYDINGKWVDGWETRRRRGLGHDWCLIRLGVPGTPAYVNIDTSHFTGNYPPAAMLEGCADLDVPDAGSRWRTLVPTAALGPDRHHVLAAAPGEPVRWLRLSIFPDGGVARLRVYGAPAFDRSLGGAERDLAAIACGGRVVGFSNAHYGTPWIILTEGRGRDMGDGWETRRRREPGHEWIVVALGAPGRLTRLEVDTAHFKGNYPDRISAQACRMTGGTDASVICQSMFWPDLLTPQPGRADHIHVFDSLAALGPVTHVRLNIHPDGGVSRLRAFGHVEA